MFVKRLRKDNRERARETSTLMANILETGLEPLSDSYLGALLERESFWALAAFLGSTVVGGLSTRLVHIRKAGSRHGTQIFRRSATTAERTRRLRWRVTQYKLAIMFWL